MKAKVKRRRCALCGRDVPGQLPADQRRRLERGRWPVCRTCRESATVYDRERKVGTLPANLRRAYLLDEHGRAAA